MYYKLLLIAIGGAVGTLARYGTGGLMRSLSERGGFPLGTLVVNVSGCFLIGLIQGAVAERWLLREEYQLALLIGVLGGYTTFSTFGYETYAMLRDGQYASAATNVLANNLLGVVMVILGYGIGRGRP